MTKACEITLIVEESDIGATGELNNVLVEKFDCDCQRIQFSAATPKGPSAFVKLLDRSRQCIIFWGTQSEGWLREILALNELSPT